tara:strand:- start:8 stop:274 length:267 start_codon:yes stop_codon:yes gene_type:complete
MALEKYILSLEKYFENPVNMKKIKKLTYIVLFLLVLIDFFIHRHHVAFFWDKIPGFNALYGFIACILIIIVSKALGKHWLSKPEDFYD